MFWCVLTVLNEVASIFAWRVLGLLCFSESDHSFFWSWKVNLESFHSVYPYWTCIGCYGVICPYFGFCRCVVTSAVSAYWFGNVLSTILRFMVCSADFAGSWKCTCSLQMNVAPAFFTLQNVYVFNNYSLGKPFRYPPLDDLMIFFVDFHYIVGISGFWSF